MKLEKRQIEFNDASAMEFFTPDNFHDDNAGDRFFRIFTADGQKVSGYCHTNLKWIVAGVFEYIPEDGSYVGVSHDERITMTLRELIVFQKLNPVDGSKIMLLTGNALEQSKSSYASRVRMNRLRSFNEAISEKASQSVIAQKRARLNAPVEFFSKSVFKRLLGE